MKVKQQKILNIDYDKYNVVKNLSLLKDMQKQGFVKFHTQTGTMITGLYSDEKFQCFYVDEVDPIFIYNNKVYGQKYFDGCFCPYVIEYINYKLVAN